MQSKWKMIFCLFILLCFSACVEEQKLDLEEIPLRSDHSGEANLFRSENRDIYLSWIEYLNDSTDVLMFSKMTDEAWSDPVKISQGSDWFVNWADFPALAVDSSGKYMAAHWLQKSATGSYDYDIKVSTSQNAGVDWSDPFTLHNDNVNAEHGFVSLLNISQDTFFAAWLDGRNTKSETKEPNMHQHAGAMSLRAAWFDSKGNVFDEHLLDDRVCDCCQTTAVRINDDILVAYRDRSHEEIRDIKYAKFNSAEKAWIKESTLHEDAWKIAACPVNGPSVAANDNIVACSWFTMADNKASVKLGISYDGGEAFYDFRELDNGRPLGRCSSSISHDEHIFSSWIEEGNSSSMLMLADLDLASNEMTKHELTEISSSRISGFPKIISRENDLILAWTAGEERTRVKTAFIRRIR